MRSLWVLGLVLTAACGGRSAGYSPAPRPTETPTATPTATDMQVVFVTYAGNQHHWTDPATKGPALIAQDNAFWNTARGSWGEISLSGTTYPTWVDSSQSMAGGCQLGQIGLDVKAAIGSWPAGGSIRHIVLPPGTPCNSQTAGTILQGGSATIYTVGGAYLEHETGHAFGLAHYPAYHCSSTGCYIQAQGPYTVMGDATHGDALNVPERIQLAVYSSTFQLMTVTSSQDVTLQVADTMTPGIKGVRVQTADSTHTLYVERRSGDYVSNGVILWGFPQGALLDLDRTTTTDRWMMKVGETYRDGTYVCVTLLAQDAMTATVHIDVPCSGVTP
jgi:hypothetical protein